MNTVNSSVQVQGAFQGSTPVGIATKEPLPLSLDEAVRRALSYNLGVIGAEQTETKIARRRPAWGSHAELLPDILGTTSENSDQLVLATTGLQSSRSIPGFAFGRTLGPFNFFKSGVSVNQRVMDLTAYRNYRSSKEIASAARANVRDSRELVILAVGGFYLQTIAAAALVDSARAQLETAQAVYKQAFDRYEAGVNARIDANRSEVEMQTQRLRVISLETDFKTQKLTLGRLIGLPLGQEFFLTTVLEYPGISPMPLDDALEAARHQGRARCRQSASTCGHSSAEGGTSAIHSGNHSKWFLFRGRHQSCTIERWVFGCRKSRLPHLAQWADRVRHCSGGCCCHATGSRTQDPAGAWTTRFAPRLFVSPQPPNRSASLKAIGPLLRKRLVRHATDLRPASRILLRLCRLRKRLLWRSRITSRLSMRITLQR